MGCGRFTYQSVVVAVATAGGTNSNDRSMVRGDRMDYLPGFIVTGGAIAAAGASGGIVETLTNRSADQSSISIMAIKASAVILRI